MHPRTSLALDALETLKCDPKGEGVDRWRALCPAHNDHTPSLTVKDTEAGPIIKCWSGCDRDKLRSLLFPEAVVPTEPLTIDGFSERRLLPLELLAACGVTADAAGVRFEYNDMAGTAVGAQVQRGYSTKAGCSWEKGSTVVPYGLWRGGEGLLWLVEGATDALTLWHLGEHALGLPGASMVDKLKDHTEYLKRFDSFIFVQEPDQAGEAFARRGVALIKDLLPAALAGRASLASAGAKDPNELLQRRGATNAKKVLADCKAEAFGDGSVTKASDVRGNILARIDRLKAGGAPCDITTGFPPLDQLNGGLNGGWQCIIAAYTGVGKSMLATQVAHHVAVNHGPVLFASWEMSHEEVCYRILGRSAPQTQEEAELLIPKIERLDKLPMFFTYSKSTTSLEHEIRTMRAAGEMPKLLVIDYLQLGCEASAAAIEQYVYSLKHIALRYRVPTLVVSQLRRPDPKSKDDDGFFPTPGVSDMHGSSGIEKSADILGVLHVDQYGHFFQVLKNRHGARPLDEFRVSLSNRLRFE